MQVTTFYFIKLVLKIKYVEFDDNLQKIYKIHENVKVFLLLED